MDIPRAPDARAIANLRDEVRTLYMDVILFLLC